MKSNIFLSLTLLLWIFTSCSKNEEMQTKSVDGVTNINKQAILQILSTPDKESQKTMYRALNNYEKNDIWKQKFDYYLLNKQLALEQNDFIKSIANQLSPQLFVDGSTQSSLLNEKEIKENAIKLFGVNEAALIFADLSLSSNNRTASLQSGACKCSTGSDWCATYMTCQQLTPCEPQDGCGLLWQHRCNGICSTEAES